MNGRRDHLGESQLKVLRKAAHSPSGQVVVTPEDNVAWCAVKRLVARKLMERQVFGSGKFGRLTVYRITEAGRTAMNNQTAEARQADGQEGQSAYRRRTQGRPEAETAGLQDGDQERVRHGESAERLDGQGDQPVQGTVRSGDVNSLTS